jgi:endonuclease/exonuclease/phosphatase family metal-dependent hydrolase
MASIKLISLNIERSKHLDLVMPFLEREKPDVVCLQEIMERDVPLFEKALDGKCFFSVNTRHQADGNPGVMGCGILSRLSAHSFTEDWYVRNSEEIPTFDFTNANTKHATENHAVLSCTVEVGSVAYKIATTHFTWTPDGKPDEYQREDLKKFLPILDSLGEFVLCGDFNAPRGGEIFSALSGRYKDNIPAGYNSSLDPDLHRIGKTKPHELDGKMVDGLFTTEEYQASDVRLEFGVSDHAAIIASIVKTL